MTTHKSFEGQTLEDFLNDKSDFILSDGSYDWFNALPFPEFSLLGDSPSTSETTSPISPIANIPVKVEEQHKAPGAKRRTGTKQKVPRKSAVKKEVESLKTSVTLSREDLVTISSKDFEQFVASASAARALNADEKKEVKRQLRMIKNRESAHHSRDKRKNLVEDLERQVSTLKNQNDTVLKDLKSVEDHNTVMKAELSQLLAVVRESPLLSEMLLNTASWMVMYAVSKAIQTQSPPLETLPEPFNLLSRPLAVC